MPTLTRKDNGLDITINYEVAGQGEPIVMHHGNGNCINDWKTLGFVDRLSPHFKLIMIDSRGYGKSSKPHSPDAYSLKSRADDTVAVLDALGIEQAHCFGASIGAAMCFILANFYPDRFKSYIFATPYFELFNEEIRSTLNVSMQYFIDLVEVLIEGKIDTRVRGSILVNDPQALIAANSSEWFNYIDYIKYIKVPSLIYVGEKEPSVDALSHLSKQLSNNQFVILKDFDHAQAYYGSDIVAPIIKNFIMENTHVHTI